MSHCDDYLLSVTRTEGNVRSAEHYLRNSRARCSDNLFASEKITTAMIETGKRSTHRSSEDLTAGSTRSIFQPEVVIERILIWMGAYTHFYSFYVYKYATVFSG